MPSFYKSIVDINVIYYKIYNKLYNGNNSKRYASQYTRGIRAKNLVYRINSGSFKSDSEIYLYLKKFLLESPINENTERLLENFLLDYSYDSLSKKKSKDSNNLRLDYLGNPKIKEFLMSSTDVLKDYLVNFKRNSFNINVQRPSQNLISRYYLQKILNVVDDRFILEISLGFIAKIISNYNKFEADSISVNLFNDIGSNIISKYYYSLYKGFIIKEIEKYCYQCKKYIDSSVSDKDKKEYYKSIDNILNNNLRLESYELINLGKKILIKDINLEGTDYILNYSFSDWKSDNQGLMDIYETNSTLRNSIGAIIVEWCNEADLIQQATISIDTKEKRNYILPSPAIIKILNLTKDYSIKHLPLRIPMIVKPKLYGRIKNVEGKVKEVLGGYLLNDEKFTDSIIIPNWELKKSSVIKDNNVVYNLVNNLNSVGFKINKDMLNFLDVYADEYNLLLPPITQQVKSRISKSEYNKLESYVSKLDLQENILGLARVYSILNEFYLPVRIDYRGRMNCISQYLNYQSTELAKSLLLFSKGEKLMKDDSIGISYFKAYGGNCYGNKLDKKSWNDRSKWIDDNELNILNYSNGVLLKEAENKLLFISFCIEYCKWKQCMANLEVSYFTTYLPIQLDASCNGYQHLSLLIQDGEMAKELNLGKSSHKDLPKDYYKFITIALKDLFKYKLSNSKLSPEDKASYERLDQMLLSRNTIKKAIMTIPYNVSTHQIIVYLKEHFMRLTSNNDNWDCYKLEYQYIENSSIILSSKDITYIAGGLREVLEQNFPKLKSLLVYLKSIANICNKLGLIIPWGTSSGLLVNQSYTASKEVKLRPFSYSKSSYILKVATSKLNANKQIRAFMPNLVHSLDAASLALLVEYYFKAMDVNEKNFYAIHDCFAVTANNVDTLIKYLKLVYIKIYSEDDYLRQLNNELIHHIKFHYKSDCFNDETLEIKVDNLTLKYPDIEIVLGNKLPTLDLIKNSSYIIT